MNNVSEDTNVYQLMTGIDWFGLGLSILLFVLVIGSYIYVFVPRWGRDLEEKKYLIFDRDKKEEQDR